MATLAKRATPTQARILRIVEGAVLNAATVHPHWPASRLARSIAKRAAGTLSAQLSEVLAAFSLLPDSGSSHVIKASRGADHRVGRSAPCGECLKHARRSPLQFLWAKLARELWSAKKAGQIERVATLIEVLKLIAAMQKTEQLK